MSTHHPTTHQSAASDLHVYGLPGIELSRVTERRQATRLRDHIAFVGTTSGRMATLRQRVGDGMIRIGTGLAGEAAKTPRVPRDAHPRIDMA